MGTVIEQSIPVGGDAQTGDKITFTISTGPKDTNVPVPNVNGMTLNQAKAALEAAGFHVEVNWLGEKSDNNSVISYEPNGSAAKGATITITVIAQPEQDGE